MKTRDDFNKPVIVRLANRVGHCCSNPDCRRATSGPQSIADGSVNIGVASHISGAAPGGPRYDSKLSPSERSAQTNGIWLCQFCAKLIDSDEKRFTSALLLAWKESAESRARALIDSPERPQDPDEPILILPTSDPDVSWLPFSARATSFIGRDEERDRLSAFIDSNRKFSWWLLTGAAGTGKSRLALELCYDFRPEWSAGFLGRTENFATWSRFRPQRPTLMVVDYVSSRAVRTSAMVLELLRSSAYWDRPVRVLLLERDEGSWWPRFLREDSQSENAEILNCRHDGPLRLGSLAAEELRKIAEDVAGAQERPWTESIKRAFDLRMRTLDPLGRPLFGIMAALYPGEETENAMVDPSLLRHVLKKERGRWREKMADAERIRQMENLVALATMTGGLLPRDGGFSFISDSTVASILPAAPSIDCGAYQDLFGTADDATTLTGFQPDILGERFVLDRLGAIGPIKESTQRLVMAAWRLQPDDYCEFVVRTASDFPGDEGLDVLCGIPLISPEDRTRWGRLVGDVLRAVNRSADKRTQYMLEELRQLAGEHAAETELQTAAARAEFYLANIFLFSERDYERAAQQFDVAIARGRGTDVEAGALNNRGILHHHVQDEDKAFADWSDVISKNEVSDEARACSLNNRADIFARRGAHGEAIRDRTEVLNLKKTSADRRYIALGRRSQSFLELGRTREALEDLEQIQRTADIAPEQKAEARLTRGIVLKGLGRLIEARADLESVLTAEALFSGTSASALVELGDLALSEGNPSRAQEYLDMISESEEVEGGTLVDTLILTARLLTQRGDVSSAETIWQSVLTNPEGNERQKSIAANRGRTTR